ncbi:YHYH protein [Pelagibacterium halotolerans]|uniref:YHYH protein n=1 Tax=Pelagibacterium halotolerans TaxID=531813 RepID=UPI00384AE13A
MQTLFHTKTLTIVTFALSASLAAISSAFAHPIVIGDGKIATSPRTGYVFSCVQQFSSNAGAHATGDWIDEAAGTWDPDLKPVVDGSVNWPSQISITVDGDKRVVRANGLPDHPTGVYPISSSDDAYQYDRNPNAISGQDVLLSLSANPQLTSSPSCLPLGMVGFALNGTAIFNALDARGDDAPAYEIQDACNGHPEATGEYHYHNLSPCLTDTRSGPNGHSDLLGYALDGFGIYGMYDEGSAMLYSSGLDECHGHVGPVMWDGVAVEIYHYHFTEDYPYTVGCFAGQDVVSLSRGGGAGDGQGNAPGGNRQPPPPRRN